MYTLINSLHILKVLPTLVLNNSVVSLNYFVLSHMNPPPHPPKTFIAMSLVKYTYLVNSSEPYQLQKLHLHHVVS